MAVHAHRLDLHGAQVLVIIALSFLNDLSNVLELRIEGFVELRLGRGLVVYGHGCASSEKGPEKKED